MVISFDPVKNARNLRERGLSFERAADFEFATAAFNSEIRNGELRRVAVGYLDERLHLLCYIPKPDGIRVISFRKTNAKEAKRYGKTQIQPQSPQDLTDRDGEVRELKAQDAAEAIAFSALPKDEQNMLMALQNQGRKRGPQKAPRKIPISIRLSPDVAEGLRATGDGWQNRADEILRSWLKTARR